MFDSKRPDMVTLILRSPRSYYIAGEADLAFLTHLIQGPWQVLFGWEQGEALTFLLSLRPVRRTLGLKRKGANRGSIF